MICVVYSEINSVGIRYLVSYILPRVQTSTKRFFVSPASPIETNIVRYFVLRLGNIHRISSFWGNFTPETITRVPRVQNVFFFFMCCQITQGRHPGGQMVENNCIWVDILEITNELIRWIFPKELIRWIRGSYKTNKTKSFCPDTQGPFWYSFLGAKYCCYVYKTCKDRLDIPINTKIGRSYHIQVYMSGQSRLYSYF